MENFQALQLAALLGVSMVSIAEAADTCLSTLMGVMLRRIEQSRPLRRQHFEPREPGIGRAPSARDRRERHGRKLPSVPGWRRSSAHQQPPCARLGALLPSPLLGGCSFAFLCLDGWGPWLEGINGLARNPAYLFLVCQLFGCLDPAFGER
jgi:hypothetical protein